jgi:[protein-PII] uridylyltransferase
MMTSGPLPLIAGTLPAAPSSASEGAAVSGSPGGAHPELRRRWHARREELRQQVTDCLPADFPVEEIDAQFQHMPLRYWLDVDVQELSWALETIHRFLRGNAATVGGDTPVVADWRACPAQGHTKLVVCTWDRAGLLARLAAYISALRLNIVRAEVFTRADDIVLDVFWLSRPGEEKEPDAELLRQLEFLIQGGLSETPRFVSTWACESHKVVAREQGIAPCVGFHNEESAEYTIVTVDASERLGLLYEVFKALSDCGLNIVEALVDTVDGVAHDIFFVTEGSKRKVPPHAHRNMEERIVRAIA